ncbi:hypothetical protein BYT27DRAFT_7184471 [Phlegmacium glaucopus]|nr:hypothetical protein BYT27DRAFT_7184471 [Phlegmacium glaucopus]
MPSCVVGVSVVIVLFIESDSTRHAKLSFRLSGRNIIVVGRLCVSLLVPIVPIHMNLGETL